MFSYPAVFGFQNKKKSFKIINSKKSVPRKFSTGSEGSGHQKKRKLKNTIFVLLKRNFKFFFFVFPFKIYVLQEYVILSTRAHLRARNLLFKTRKKAKNRDFDAIFERLRRIFWRAARAGVRARAKFCYHCARRKC